MTRGRVPEKILMVDDDPRILAGFMRNLRDTFTVSLAAGGEQALQVLGEQGPFAVVVSDLRMPGMDGVELLRRVKALFPDTVRLMLTGFADIGSAIAAVNQGSVFRFLTKPCDEETLTRALADGIRQYRLVIAERELLEKTLTGSIRTLTDILGLLNPTALGRSSRIQVMALDIAREMGETNLWALETAALLSQLGMVLVPPSTLENLYQGKRLEGEEQQLFDMHPLLAADLLKNIPRLDEVSRIVAHQEKRFDGEGPPLEGPVGKDIPLGARVLKVSLDYDLLQSRHQSSAKALNSLKNRHGWYDPEVLKALARVLEKKQEFLPAEVGLKDLTENMVLAEDVLTIDGVLVVPAGYGVTRLLVKLLGNFQEKKGLRLPLKVLPRKEDAGANPEAA